jgi:Xaa-Pro dipeptidase
MKEEGLHQLIVTSEADLFYYLGKWISTGERMISLYINVNGETKLIINEIIMNPKEFNDIDVIGYRDGEDPVGILLKLIDSSGKPVGIDKNWPSHFLIELMERNSALKFVNSSKVVDNVRLIKGNDEIEKLVKSSEIVDKVMHDFIGLLPKKFSEKEAEGILLDLFKNHGAAGFSFEPIVAYGTNAANPHHINSEAVPKNGDSIIIDIGGVADDYCSDTTRTVFFGEPCDELKSIFEIVKAANKAAEDRVRPGVTFSEVDRAARNVIEEAGYGMYFSHRTGHGLGIEVHEMPSVAEGNNAKLEAGMVFSIEPGIYIDGKYGVRIEDIVVVTEDGCKVLNHFTKDMIIIR